jgi:hypothetical protein
MAGVAMSDPDVTIPDEAVVAALAASSRALDNQFDDPAWAALKAAAPLIVAAAFEQYAASIDYDHIRSKTTRPRGRLTAVDLVREDLLRIASELRGGETDA